MQVILNDMGIPLQPIGILCLIVILVIFWRRKHTFSYLFFFSIFWIYILSALDKVFFPIQINGLYVDVMRQVPIMSEVNLVPFFLGQDALPEASFVGLLYNLILTVPFGFGLNFISRVRIRDFLLLSIVIGLGFEVIQFTISLILGYPYRVVDINDALMNTLGVLLGYGLFRSFAWLYLKMTQRLSIEHTGLSSYIYNVAYQAQTAEN